MPTKSTSAPPKAASRGAWFERRTVHRPAVVGEEGLVDLLLVIDDAVERVKPIDYAPLVVRGGSTEVLPGPRETLLGTEVREGRTVRVYRIERRAFVAGDFARSEKTSSMTLVGPSASNLEGACAAAVCPGVAPPDEIVTISHAPSGAPSDFHEGDVGVFTLTAEVRPRQVHPGGAVSVTVVLEGDGHVPEAVTLPVKSGVAFGKPEVLETREVSQNAASTPPLAGSPRNSGAPNGALVEAPRHLHITRTFRWTATLSTDEPDAAFVDLGAVTLPFWNPDTQKYERASAELGRVALAAPTLPESPSAPTITVQDVSETPWLRADSPVLTGLGVGLIVGAAVALAVGLRKKRG